MSSIHWRQKDSGCWALYFNSEIQEVFKKEIGWLTPSMHGWIWRKKGVGESCIEIANPSLESAKMFAEAQYTLEAQ